jgi:MFS family permease
MKEIERPQATWGEEEKKKFGFLSSFRDLFRQSSLLKIWLSYAVISSFFKIILRSFRYVYINEVKGGDQYLIGAMTTAAVLIQIITYTPIGRLSDRIGRKKILYILLPITWISYLLYVYSTRPILLLIAGMLTGFQNMSVVVENAISAELVPREYMGRWIGITGLFVGLIDIPAPVIGGMIWEHLDPSYLFIIPILIDLFIKIPILRRMPETLHGGVN